MSPHAFVPSPPRPIFIRTHRPWWLRLLRPVAAIAVLALAGAALVLATTWVIGRMHATEAALAAAHAQGMAAGMRSCAPATADHEESRDALHR